MVSLWGSKNGGDEETQTETAVQTDGEPSNTTTANTVVVRPTQTHYREPDERTRLLPPRGHSRFLDPDDPAVTPYNLWSVRALRFLSIIFLAISFIWWIILLVSIFVTPPGLHTRGSGFFNFAFITLTVANLLVGLIFYTTPSKAQRIACLTLAVLLLVDVIIILVVSRIRGEEGWIGVATVGWAMLMAVWTVITDRVVEWGKREEEERLTGRPETRRTLGEWCGVMASTVILFVLLAVVVLISAVLILRTRDSTLSPPGERYYVNNGRYQVHLYCEGQKSSKPTVFFEGGEQPVETGLVPFAANALKNGTIDRYCYWDRPGYAFSDNAPSPFSAGMAADALSEALVRAGEEGPWVLVSAGVGSIYSRIFASRHVSEVAGIMLVDALHEDLLYRIGSPGRGFMLWVRGIISPLGIDRLLGAIFQGRSRADRVYGKSAYQSDKVIKAKLQENLVATGLTKNEINAARTIQNPDTQLSVISSAVQIRRDRKWNAMQRDLSQMTDELIGWDIVEAPHEVWQKLEGREIMEKRLKELVEG